MSDESIQPALTPEEWARAQELAARYNEDYLPEAEFILGRIARTDHVWRMEEIVGLLEAQEAQGAA